MGRLTYETTIHHFSHPHPLHLSSSSDQTLIPLSCAACSSSSNSSNNTWTYSCKPCKFNLHLSCSQLPPLINHPSHPTHPLTLLPTPIYPEGYFNCDACANSGTGFSYCCAPCGLDIHTVCASVPLSVNHYAHVHPLTLAFFPPYDNKGFSCDVCGSLGGNHWLYRCALCEFDVHLGCGARPVPVQRVVSRVGSAGVNRVGSGGMNNVMRQAVQQIGQSLFQESLGGGDGGGSGGGGNNGGGDGDGGDGGGGSLMLDIGSAVISTVFGGGNSSESTENN